METNDNFSSSDENFFSKNWPELTLCILGTILLAVLMGSTLTDWAISVTVFLILWILLKTSAGKKIEQFCIQIALWSVGLSPAQHRGTPYEHSDIIRAGALMLVMMVPIGFGILGAKTTFVDVFHCLAGVALVAGIGWGICVFFIDRVLITTMKRKANGKYPMGSFFIRFGIAFFLGILISSCAELRWFDTEIQEERNLQIVEQTKAIKKLEKADIAKVDEKIAAERKRVDDKYQAVTDETDKSIGGRNADFGRVARLKKGWADEAQKKFEQEILPPLEAEKAEIHEEYELRRQNMVDNNSNGFAARMEYLFDAGKRHPIVGIWHFVIFGFIVIIELLPVVAKMIMPAGPNDFKIMEEMLVSEKLYMDKQLDNMMTEQRVAMAVVQDTNALNLEKQKGAFDLRHQSVERTMDTINLLGERRGPTGKGHMDLVIERYLDSIKNPDKFAGSVKLRVA